MAKAKGDTKGTAKGGDKGKGKVGDDKAAAGKVKGAQSINVRHILVSLWLLCSASRKLAQLRYPSGFT